LLGERTAPGSLPLLGRCSGVPGSFPLCTEVLFTIEQRKRVGKVI